MNENNPPFFSIVMAVYNCESYVARSIESVLAQTYASWELIVVDDHSVDCTSEILNKYSAADERIRVMRNEKNLHISRSVNRGIQAARGTWIVRIDADDFFESDYLEKLRWRIDSISGELCFISTWISVVDEYGKKILDVRLPDAETIRRMMRIENFLYQSATSFSKALWELVGHYPEGDRSLSEDTEMWKRFFNAGAKLYMMEEPLVNYRIHYSNTTSIKDAGLEGTPSPEEMKALRQNREWRISLYLKQKMLKAARDEIMELNRLQHKLSVKNVQYYMLTYMPESLVHFFMWEFRPRMRHLLRGLKGRRLGI